MIIQHEQEGSKGHFVALEEGKQIGEMTYSVAGPDKIIIDHTEVDPEEKGKGIGHVMLYKAVEYARENAIKILPLCPFAKASFDRDVHIRDVLFT
ncbi:N-acetyltransferase [Sphingobacterium alkalisoli]|uniref:N-acetyltransferase n=1 Tax=Sphingobacterium alkalisoli TaxID=1874115 RepID=A0A4U0H275_9SPHI|nr:GNAT family N-acetyltransferase [Sphingobacterium alkalisoli]TJY65558.1 N-acetyltransferase [Sphingobacterium alkalisoli]GGH19738.1 N-acetyltransferase [Sphingobacterium alkalisoli]